MSRANDLFGCIRTLQLKSVFLKNVLGKIVWPKNSQKLPRWIHWFQRGSFCEFLGQTIFQSTFFKKTDFSFHIGLEKLHKKPANLNGGPCRRSLNNRPDISTNAAARKLGKCWKHGILFLVSINSVPHWWSGHYTLDYKWHWKFPISKIHQMPPVIYKKKGFYE